MLPRIVVAGNGQLGQMLQQAGAPMQLEVMPVDPNADVQLELRADDVITVEIEHWSDSVSGLQLKQHPNFRNKVALHMVVDRQRQKSLLDRLQVPTSPGCPSKAMICRHSWSRLANALSSNAAVVAMTAVVSGAGRKAINPKPSGQVSALPRR